MMESRAASRVALAFGFVAASVAYGGWIAQQTAFNPDSSGAVAKALLESPPVRDALEDEIAKHVAEANLLDPNALDAQLLAAIDEAVHDPRFVDAFADGVREIHRQLLDGTDGQFTLDTAAVTAAVRDEIGALDPALGEQLAAQPLQIDLGDAELPQLSDARDRSRMIMVLVLLIALLLFGAGVAVAPDRRQALGRVGRRVAYLSLTPLVLFVIAPWGLRGVGTEGTTVAADVLEVYQGRVLPSMLLLVFGGLGIWIGARVWPQSAPAPAPTQPIGTSGWSGLPNVIPSSVPARPGATNGDRPTERLYL
jgi:hypothetical protein